MGIFSVFSLFNEVETKDEYVALERKLHRAPSEIVKECQENMILMVRQVQDSAFIALGLVGNYSRKKAEEVEENSIQITQYGEKLGNSLMEVLTQELSERDKRQIIRILSVLYEFERMGNCAWGISRSVTEMLEERMVLTQSTVPQPFGNTGMGIQKQHMEFVQGVKVELELLRHAVEEAISMSITSYLTDDAELAKEVEPLAEVIRYLCMQLKKSHIQRLRRGQCTVEQSRYYQELLSDCERIVNECFKVALWMQQEMYEVPECLEGKEREERDCLEGMEKGKRDCLEGKGKEERDCLEGMEKGKRDCLEGRRKEERGCLEGMEKEKTEWFQERYRYYREKYIRSYM